MPKRTKFLLSSILIPLLPLALSQLEFSLALTVFVTLSVTALAAYWSQNFDLRWYEFLIFPLPLLLVVVVALLFSEVRCQMLGVRCYTDPTSWLTLIAEGVLLYITFLTLNILNTATVRTVPLKKAALSTFYFLGLILTFAFTYAHREERFLVLPVLVGIWVLAVATPFLYYATERVRLLEPVLLGLLVGEIALVSLFWPSQSLIRIVFVVGSAFVLLGVLQHHLQRDLSRSLRREYLVVGLVLALAFLLG